MLGKRLPRRFWNKWNTTVRWELKMKRKKVVKVRLQNNCMSRFSLPNQAEFSRICLSQANWTSMPVWSLFSRRWTTITESLKRIRSKSSCNKYTSDDTSISLLMTLKWGLRFSACLMLICKCFSQRRVRHSKRCYLHHSETPCSSCGLMMNLLSWSSTKRRWTCNGFLSVKFFQWLTVCNKKRKTFVTRPYY